MSDFSDYAENALINHLLRNTSLTSPTTVYVGLHTASPGETGANEVSGSGYSRQAAAFDAPSNGASTNSDVETFTASGGNWGSITHFSIWDASSAGNCLFVGALDTSRTINDGDSLQFAAGSITVTLA